MQLQMQLVLQKRKLAAQLMLFSVELNQALKVVIKQLSLVLEHFQL